MIQISNPHESVTNIVWLTLVWLTVTLHTQTDRQTDRDTCNLLYKDIWMLRYENSFSTLYRHNKQCTNIDKNCFSQAVFPQMRWSLFFRIYPDRYHTRSNVNDFLKVFSNSLKFRKLMTWLIQSTRMVMGRSVFRNLGLVLQKYLNQDINSI